MDFASVAYVLLRSMDRTGTNCWVGANTGPPPPISLAVVV